MSNAELFPDFLINPVTKLELEITQAFRVNTSTHLVSLKFYMTNKATELQCSLSNKSLILS